MLDKRDTGHCCQKRARSVPCWAQHKHCHHLALLWSKNVSDILTICGYDSRLCMFSFYQIHPMSINKTDGNSSSEDGITLEMKATTNLTSSHTSSFLSGATLLWRGRPKRPNNGNISAFLVFITVIGIFTALTGMTCRIILATSSQPSTPSERDTL